MRVPPPFAASLAPTAWLRIALAGFGAVASSVFGVWVARAVGLPWLATVVMWLAIAIAIATAIASAATALRSPPKPVWLAWNGSRWVIDGPHEGVLEVAMDLGGWMLLRWSPRPVARWAPWQHRWIETGHRGMGEAWNVFRATVYASAGEGRSVGLPSL